MHLVSVITLLFLSWTLARDPSPSFPFGVLRVNNNIGVDHAAAMLRHVVGKIVQPFDHSIPNDQRTWEMRYFKNLELWRANGPVIIFIGGEGSISDMAGYIDPRSEVSIVTQLAKETNGAMYMSEHRYYGESQLMPAPIDYKYLSSMQALADVAQLIREIKSKPDFAGSKVVVVGGSYAGNLAAWMRVRYPDLVDAAVAASAPVLAKKDFHEYLDVTGDVFEQYGTPGCLQNIHDKIAKYNEMLQTSQGIEKLKREHDICREVDMTKKENQQSCFFPIYYNYLGIQYDNPSTIQGKCSANDIMEVPLNCMDCSFDTTFSPNNPQLLKSWMYQSCNEFGYLQTSYLSTRVAPYECAVDFFIKACRNLFGEAFSEQRLDQMIADVNKAYGGVTPKVSNVVFTNGDIDPWHALGVTRDLSPTAPALLTRGTSHCAVMFYRSGEPQELTEARNRVKHLIKQWIGIPSFEYNLK